MRKLQSSIEKFILSAIIVVVSISVSYFLYSSFYSVSSHIGVKSYLAQADFSNIYGNKTSVFILLKNKTEIGSNVLINERITFSNGTSNTITVPFDLGISSQSGSGYLYSFETTDFPTIATYSQPIKISNINILSGNSIIESENNSIDYTSYYYTKSSLSTIPLYYLNMSASILNAGVLTPGNGYYYASSKIAISEKPNAGYVFNGWDGSGNGNYTGDNQTAIITMNSNISEYANFVKLVKIYVNATYDGIPAYVNGELNATTNGTIYLMPGAKYTLSVLKYISLSNGTSYEFKSMQDDCGISISPNSNYTTFVPSYANYNCKFMANYIELPFILLYVSNGQSIATPNPFQQMIQFSPSSYSQYENSNLGNIRFYQGSTELHSWCESGCSSTASQATFWINLPSGIPANSVVTVKMAFEPPSTNYDGIYAGEAGYGKYDNGVSVFPYYQSFGGLSALPSGWTAISGTVITYDSAYTEIAPSSSTAGWYGIGLNPLPSSLSSTPTVWEFYGNMYDSIQIPTVYNPTSYNGLANIIFNQNTGLTGSIIAYSVTIKSGVTLTTNGYSIISTDNFTNYGAINTGSGIAGGSGGSWGSAGSNGASITTSYGGSGGGGGYGGCGAYGASGGSGGWTTVSGGGQNANGGTPTAPTLSNSTIANWYNNGIENYLEGAGAGGAGSSSCGGGASYGGNGGNGGEGIYIQATNITAGTINSNGQNGGNGACSFAAAGGGGGGGGGGSIILAYSGNYIAGAYNTNGGSGGAGEGCGVGSGGTGGSGGSGLVLAYKYTTQPVYDSAFVAVGDSYVGTTTGNGGNFNGYSFSEGNSTPNLIYLGNKNQFSASTGYSDTNDSKVYTMQINSGTSVQMFINYSQIYSTTSATLESPTYFEIDASNNGGSESSNPIYIYWIRARSYPPNGVMPSVNFGNIQ